MSSFEEVAFAESVRRPAPKYPEGWEPGVAWDGRRGRVAVETQGEPDWSIVLERANLDPATIEVVPGTVQVRTWDAAIGNGEVRTFRYYRAEVRAKRDNAPDMMELARLIRRRRAVPAERPTGAQAFVMPMSDWQVGKRGTREMIDGLSRAIEAAAARLKVVRARPGVRIGSVVIPFLGDLVESCTGQYDMQTFEVTLDNREQDAVCWDLAFHAIDTMAPLAERIIVPVVGGNHGENRKDGKAFTSFGDNRDISIVENVERATRQNPARFGHVSYVIPGNELSLTLEVGGLITGFIHGHQAKSGPNSSKKLETYWSGQSFGWRPVGDAVVLYSGHYHHLRIEEMSKRRWQVQVPTTEIRSQWLEEKTGKGSTPGVLTVVQGPDGLRDWEVL